MTAAGAGDGPPPRRVVIGVGNDFRRDDGLGPAVVDRLRKRQPVDPELATVTLATSDGEPSRMIDLWSGADLAVVIDAVHDTRVPAGHRYELSVDALPGAAGASTSSHSIGLGETVTLARALGRMPVRLLVFAVAGRDFGYGVGLTDPVAAAVDPLVERVRTSLR